MGEMDLSPLREARTMDELVEAANGLLSLATTAEEADAIDAVMFERQEAINSAPPDPETLTPPSLNLEQRNHFLIVRPPRDTFGVRLEYQARIGNGEMRDCTRELFATEDADNVLCIPASGWKTIDVRARREGGNWGPIASVSQLMFSRVTHSNVYWHFFKTDSLENFTSVCKALSPGVNDLDAYGNTIGHIIAAHPTSYDVDSHGNYLDARGVNRLVWLGRQIGTGRNDDVRGAGLDPTIRNRRGETIADILESQGLLMRDWLSRAEYAGAPWEG